MPKKRPPQNQPIPDELDHIDEELLARGMQILDRELGHEDALRFLAMATASLMDKIVAAGQYGECSEPAVYTMKITLLGSNPQIWRRFTVSNMISLGEFHDILQIVMGWTDSHLHIIEVGDNQFSLVDDDGEMPPDCDDEERVLLGQVLKKKGAKLIYEYDLGDGWTHAVTLEKITLIASGEYPTPEVLAGENACPPEDSGGIDSYYDAVEQLSGAPTEDNEDLREWYGEDFDPCRFNVDEVNKQLRDYWLEPEGEQAR
jgi:hypothetical protein